MIIGWEHPLSNTSVAVLVKNILLVARSILLVLLTFFWDSCAGTGGIRAKDGKVRC